MALDVQKKCYKIRPRAAEVVKLVDTPDLGSGAVRCESSSLSFRTIFSQSLVKVRVRQCLKILFGKLEDGAAQSKLPLNR